MHPLLSGFLVDFFIATAAVLVKDWFAQRNYQFWSGFLFGFYCVIAVGVCLRRLAHLLQQQPNGPNPVVNLTIENIGPSHLAPSPSDDDNQL